VKALPFYLLLIITFATASLEKLRSPAAPNWFLEQFKNTVLDLFPGALTLAFFSIAALELVTFLLILAGLLRKEFLKSETKPLLSAGLILAQVTFLVLGFGQRLTHQFDQAGFLFFYTVLTYIGGHIALKEKPCARNT
jgi:hypothetical protein